jgi:hypothetical protein
VRGTVMRCQDVRGGIHSASVGRSLLSNRDLSGG